MIEKSRDVAKEPFHCLTNNEILLIFGWVATSAENVYMHRYILYSFIEKYVSVNLYLE